MNVSARKVRFFSTKIAACNERHLILLLIDRTKKRLWWPVYTCTFRVATSQADAISCENNFAIEYVKPNNTKWEVSLYG